MGKHAVYTGEYKCLDHVTKLGNYVEKGTTQLTWCCDNALPRPVVAVLQCFLRQGQGCDVIIPKLAQLLRETWQRRGVHVHVHVHVHGDSYCLLCDLNYLKNSNIKEAHAVLYNFRTYLRRREFKTQTFSTLNVDHAIVLNLLPVVRSDQNLTDEYFYE